MNRIRPKQMVIRMSAEEYEKVKSQVKKSGMKQQDYLIKCITGKAIVNTEGVKNVLPELKRVGNNLNQLAKVCNSNYPIEHDEIIQMGKELNEVWRLLRQLAQGQVSEKQ